MGASDNFVINCWRCVVFGKADKVFLFENYVCLGYFTSILIFLQVGRAKVLVM